MEPRGADQKVRVSDGKIDEYRIVLQVTLILADEECRARLVCWPRPKTEWE